MTFESVLSRRSSSQTSSICSTFMFLSFLIFFRFLTGTDLFLKSMLGSSLCLLKAMSKVLIKAGISMGSGLRRCQHTACKMMQLNVQANRVENMILLQALSIMADQRSRSYTKTAPSIGSCSMISTICYQKISSVSWFALARRILSSCCISAAIEGSKS